MFENAEDIYREEEACRNEEKHDLHLHPIYLLANWSLIAITMLIVLAPAHLKEVYNAIDGRRHWNNERAKTENDMQEEQDLSFARVATKIVGNLRADPEH